VTEAAATEPLDRPRVSLAGDVAARPDGLERALTRAGFHVSESPCRSSESPADAILITTFASSQADVAQLLAPCPETPPRILLLAAADPDLPAAALTLGADDAMAAPVHFGELCARIHARIRDRQAPSRTPYEQEVRETLKGLVAEASASLHPEEIVLALVRRLARAFGLAGCAFVSIGPNDHDGRVVTELGLPELREHLDLRGQPEILEAIRTRRPVTWTDDGLAIPVPSAGTPTAVLLVRRRQGTQPLAAAQLALAGSLAEAAARALELKAAPGHNGRAAAPEAVTLGHRLREEFERARRYSLSFSFLLLAAEAVGDASDRLAAELRRILRLPDFITRYGDAEFAILLPETDADGARRSFHRLRERVMAVPAGALTAGIVTYPHPAATRPDDLFALVEAALERGKALGGKLGLAE
jgi:diguanylate cyclase with GGDEF domain